LVPQDHFYRHLERSLDLSLVREFVQKTYAGSGRPSIDPVVFFKLQLVLFFEGLRVSTTTDAACGRPAQHSLVLRV
jgi:transposase